LVHQRSSEQTRLVAPSSQDSRRVLTESGARLAAGDGAHDAPGPPCRIDHAAARRVPVTGQDVAWEFVHIWRVQDGRIAEHWACRDDLGLLRQLGAWSPG
jgi:hypothetical protein